jgi:Uma2 family endonuclease
MSVFPVRHRVSVHEFQRMVGADVFAPDERLELIDGEILQLSPIGTAHQACVLRLTTLFSRLAADEDAALLVQGTFRIGDWSMPQPDAALLRWRGDHYADAHPRPDDLLLAVEVADSSLRYDRETKRPLYARAGVVETWIIDVKGGVVDVATGPTGDGYGRVVQVGPGDAIAPSAFPDLTVDVAWLLGDRATR